MNNKISTCCLVIFSLIVLRYLGHNLAPNDTLLSYIIGCVTGACITLIILDKELP